MFDTLRNWWHRLNGMLDEPSSEAAEAAARPAIAVLDQQAPLKDAGDDVAGVAGGAGGANNSAAAEARPTFLCREAILGRNQRIAGYQFMLQEATRNRIRSSSRRIHHVYAEVLVRSLASTELPELLGHRLAFIDIPDSFLGHASLDDLSAAHTVLVISTLPDGGGLPQETLLAHVKRLREDGFRIAIPDPDFAAGAAPLLPLADMVLLHASMLDAHHSLALVKRLSQQAPQAQLLVRGVARMDDFRFCYKLGCHLFQGPFITSREDWQDRHLATANSHIVQLLQKLRQDADTSEVTTLIKQDPALSLRLLRYINSAANALPNRVSSIEAALMLLGRDQLRRWLTLLLCSNEDHSGRGSAALESALVRARMMELLAQGRSNPEREMLFLTGLLSLADIMLQVPMPRALASLAVAPEIQAAIVEHQGQGGALLQLAMACEHGDADGVRQSAERCGISPLKASEAHLRALQWALTLQH